MTTGPQDPVAAGRGRVRAGHADREQAIEALKDAFVHGRLTKDELDARAGQALAARTRADLAALTADIPPAPARPAAAGLARPPAPARRRPLARAAAKSGGCLVIAAAAVWAIDLFDPNGPGPNPPFWVGLMILLAVSGLWTALGIMGYAVFTSWDQRSSRRQLPPRPGPGGHALGGEQCGGTGHGPVPPGPRTDQTRAGLRTHIATAAHSRPSGPGIPWREASARRGMTPVKPAPGPVPPRLSEVTS